MKAINPQVLMTITIKTRFKLHPFIRYKVARGSMGLYTDGLNYMFGGGFSKDE